MSENDVSWWLDSEDRILYINDEKVDLNKLEDFWKYLEENRQIKLKNKE